MLTRFILRSILAITYLLVAVWPLKAAVEDIPDFGFCEQAPQALRETCQDCYAQGQIWTGVGCISYESQSSMVSNLLQLLVGMGGGLALVFILFSAFTISTSTSNPERLKTGQEMLVSAIGGLLFIIFSVILLRFIGVDLLQIPGFGS